MTGGLDARLVIWFSPAFPVGSFAYSHGLEWAVESGAVRTAADLEAWIAGLIRHGSLALDLAHLRAAYDATQAEDQAELGRANALALALAPTAERHLETVAQGNAFVAAVAAGWPASVDGSTGIADWAYPVAVGHAAAREGAALEGTLEAYGLAFIAMLISAAIRLGVIGQTEGVRLTARLSPEVTVTAQSAVSGSIGAASFAADLASAAHETQYSRLFRS